MPKQGTSTQRGYNHHHRTLRKQWEPKVATGTVNCARCHQPITPNQQWDLGHIDGTNDHAGPEHALRYDCPAGGNRATKGRQQWRRPAEPHPGLTRPA